MIDVDALNAYLDEEHVIIALRARGGNWTTARLTRREAVQLADQLYLLTKERP